MMYRFSLLVLIAIISIAFLFCLCTSSFAASTLVEGNSDSISILTYTKYLDDHPVLIFSEQIEEKNINLLNKINNIVLCDSTWQDLATEFAVQVVFVNPKSTVRIERDGIYEVFVDNPQLTVYSPLPEMKIDGKEMLWAPVYESKDRGQKYIKLGERRLKAGKHLVEIKSLEQNSKTVLVSKQKKQGVQKVILQRINERKVDTAYVFSRDREFYVPKKKRYTLKMRIVPEPIESEENVIHEVPDGIPLVEIDGKELSDGDYIGKENVSNSESFWYEINDLDLREGKHKVVLLNGDSYRVDLALLEPANGNGGSINGREPEIIFKRINPTKYLVKVSQAKQPFWLVFSEGFHKEWRLYKLQKADYKQLNGLEDIVADYPDLGVQEARHLQKFTFGDIKYLLRQADSREHFLVNGYANGWYIDPSELGLGRDFTLVLYFWPQSLFYFGLIISGSTLLFCVGYLVWDWKRKRKRNSLIQAQN